MWQGFWNVAHFNLPWMLLDATQILFSNLTLGWIVQVSAHKLWAAGARSLQVGKHIPPNRMEGLCRWGEKHGVPFVPQCIFVKKVHLSGDFAGKCYTTVALSSFQRPAGLSNEEMGSINRPIEPSVTSTMWRKQTPRSIPRYPQVSRLDKIYSKRFVRRGKYHFFVDVTQIGYRQRNSRVWINQELKSAKLWAKLRECVYHQSCPFLDNCRIQ